MVNRHGGATNLFAVSMRSSPAKTSFEVRGLAAKAEADVLGEDRKVAFEGWKLKDVFDGYVVHICRIK